MEIPYNPFISEEEAKEIQESLINLKHKTKPNHWSWNQEQKQRCSERAKKRFANKENHPSYGKHRSDEIRKKISISTRAGYDRLTEEEKAAYIKKRKQSWTPEMRQAAGERLTKRLKGKPNCRTPPASNTRTTSIQGVRTDLNQFFRSTWEANFARILNYLNIRWEYEPYRYIFEHFSYVPDFYLPETDSWVEVYSYLSPLKAAKIHSMGNAANLQLVNHNIYNELEKEYKDKIPNWEIGRGKLRRNNPLVTS
jgi:hypothetical protein